MILILQGKQTMTFKCVAVWDLAIMASACLSSYQPLLPFRVLFRLICPDRVLCWDTALWGVFHTAAVNRHMPAYTVFPPPWAAWASSQPVGFMQAGRKLLAFWGGSMLWRLVYCICNPLWVQNHLKRHLIAWSRKWEVLISQILDPHWRILSRASS